MMTNESNIKDYAIVAAALMENILNDDQTRGQYIADLDNAYWALMSAVKLVEIDLGKATANL